MALFQFRSQLGEEPFVDPASRERLLIQLGSDPDTVVNHLLAILDEIDLSGSNLAYALATLAAEEEDWQRMGELLEAVDSATVASHFRRHFHHLRGLFQLTRGRWREARECFTAGVVETGGCQFHQLLELTKVVELGELGEEDRQPESPLTFQVCGAIQAADRALSAASLISWHE